MDACAARSCPVKTHNAFDPTARRPTGDASARPADALAELFDGAERFNGVVLARLVAACDGRAADLRPLAGESPEIQAAACLRELASGAAVVIGGLLPADDDGHRVGRPDVLVRGEDTTDGQPGYHPVVVKWHKILERPRPRPPSSADAEESPGPGPATQPDETTGPAARSIPDHPSTPSTPERPGPSTADRPAPRLSSLGRPEPEGAPPAPGLGLRLGSRAGDFLQLAHYRRMLEAAGHAAPSPWGGVISTDEPDEAAGLGDAPVIAWADLAAPALRTFSRSDPQGWRLRSILERYDFELAFRVDIAAQARRRTSEPGGGCAPLVRPIVNAECAHCPWWEHCRSQLDPDDVSLRIARGPLDPREIATLRSRGIATITDLVTADLTETLTWYLPEVTHRSAAEARLRTAIRRARMLLTGRAFDRETSGPIVIERAEVEIDFDLESAADGRVYLWGFLLDDSRLALGPVYRAFSQFGDLDDDAEAQLARRAMRWLREVAAGAGSVAVFHYSDYEVARIRDLARSGALRRLDVGEHGDQSHPASGTTPPDDDPLDWALSFADAHFVDLLEVVKAHFFGAEGLGLKLVARHAGFSWRDEDPGGLNSQLWFADAVHADTSAQRERARRRVLEYNEDDVLATRAVRSWLRAQGG